jgi:1-acyl-sn-glycerol-3-phosphate acyltransferase
MSLNNNIIMFPEGSRGEAGQLQRFRKGAMRFSMGLNVPVLPASIIGTEKVWPKGEWFMKPGKITIKILPPIYPKDSSQMSEQEVNKEISSKTSELQQIVEQGLAELTS